MVRETISERWQGLLYDLMAGERLSDKDIEWLVDWLGHQSEVADTHDDIKHMKWCVGWQAILLEQMAKWEAQDKREAGLA